MFEKKATIDPLKIVMITVLSAFIFIYFVLILVQNSDLTIDEKKINSQLVVSKLFNGQCFSEDFATFKKSKLNDENMIECFKNKDDKILFRIKVLSETDYLYAGDTETEFNSKKAFCNLESNVLCTRLVYPITFVDDNNAYSNEKLLVEIITF